MNLKRRYSPTSESQLDESDGIALRMPGVRKAVGAGNFEDFRFTPDQARLEQSWPSRRCWGIRPGGWTDLIREAFFLRTTLF